MDNNILTWGITCIFINILLTGIFYGNQYLATIDPIQLTEQDTLNILSNTQDYAQQYDIDTGICRTGDTNCTTQITQQTTGQATAQSPWDTFLNIFGYFGKALQIMASIPIIGIIIARSVYSPSAALNILLALIAIAWNLITVYYILKLMLGDLKT